MAAQAGLREKICRTLDEAQSGLHHHQKLLKSLRALHDKHDLDEFFDVFFPHFSNVLLVYKSEPTAERVVDFAAKFAASVASTAPEEGKSNGVYLP